MEEYIQEVRDALKKECYLAALTLSMTLPDICSQVENGVKDGNRTLYINWIKKHMAEDSFHFPLSGFETQTFTGEMCYSLRCKVLHNGNTEVTNKTLQVLVDHLVLTKPGTEEHKHGYNYVEKNNLMVLLFI